MNPDDKYAVYEQRAARIRKIAAVIRLLCDAPILIYYAYQFLDDSFVLKNVATGSNDIYDVFMFMVFLDAILTFCGIRWDPAFSLHCGLNIALLVGLFFFAVNMGIYGIIIWLLLACILLLPFIVYKKMVE